MFSRDERITSEAALVSLASILGQPPSNGKIAELNKLRKELLKPACEDDAKVAIIALLISVKILAEMLQQYLTEEVHDKSLNCYHYLKTYINKMIVLVNKDSFDMATQTEFSVITQKLFMVNFDPEKILDIINDQHLEKLLETTKSMPMTIP